MGAGSNPKRFLRRCLLEIGKATAQALGVELVDGKNSNTALRTSGTADQPCAAALGGIGQGGIHDLDEGAIFGGGKTSVHGFIYITQCGALIGGWEVVVGSVLRWREKAIELRSNGRPPRLRLGQMSGAAVRIQTLVSPA